MRRTKAWLAACVLCALLTATSGQPRAQDALQLGEERVEAGGYPAVSYFTKGDPDKPLIVFIPGAHHMARIAYGGHEGARDTDFLAHWLAEEGYSFLGLSYPIGVEGVFDRAYPDFDVQAWGQQVAELTKRAVDANGLSNHVVFLHWSMGGKVVQAAYEDATEAGLDVLTAVSFAATPGLPGLTGKVDIAMDPSGYADRSDLYPGWIRQLADNDADNGGHVAIPEEVYRRSYLGPISVQTQGYGQVYRDGRFEIDEAAQSRDYNPFAYDAFPLVVVMANSEVADSRHALLDRAYWTFYNAHTVTNRYLAGNGIKPGDLPAEKWRALTELVASADERLTVPVGGNHFFFVGEQGARTAAYAVERAITAAERFKQDVSDAIGVAVE
ncbi:hypothetical protein [Marinivivus vitaminiproducens]|uniref:hypothetical protein n=1 Tax=Marinivivus vitaminiproducens TaxID=3035935 RepID=UPI0027A4F4DC|nr:hypothetical protein P4R82_09480 [Geminicoccaceae bacterium SCSIO 64248]